ncbi:putative Antirepressor [uncultured Sporomusa sp.]|uniref:Putative Antirepressor n=1 Tax=uncultured Sporomusa sp. TaxID=307249 RepID=A0A212M1U1_9FIRM|nr:Rha family transcriptional regulator [uncultured Sporomusa sp.]SCM83726.1 putative Antirepressor [uncultured Sporomusa sp.]
MNNLVQITNGQAVVSSRQVAENFGKNHRDVLESISGIVRSAEFSATSHMFYKSTYVHPQNKQEYPEFIMNRDGFTLLAMGFTGSKALEWKLKYIQAFNEMEKQLTVPQTYLEALKALVVTEEAKLLAEAKVQELTPKGEYYDALVERELLTNFRDTAKEIGMPERKFIQWLTDKGYIYRDQSKQRKSPLVGFMRILILQIMAHVRYLLKILC